MISNCIQCDKEIYAGEMWCGDCVKELFYFTEEEENASKTDDN